MTLALFRLRAGYLPAGPARLLVARGLPGGLAVLLYFVALARIPAGQATLLNNLFPVFAVGISIFTLGERPTVHLALALALVSVAVGSSSWRPAPGRSASTPASWPASPRRCWAGGPWRPSARSGRPTTRPPSSSPSAWEGCSAHPLLRRRLAPRSSAVGPRGRGGGPLLLRPAPHDARLRRLHGRRGGPLAAAHAGGELPVGDAVLDERLSPWALGGIVLGGCGVVYGSVLGHRPGGGRCARSRVTSRSSRWVDGAGRARVSGRRARLLLCGSALSFGLMAVLARGLSRGPGGFTAGSAVGGALRHRRRRLAAGVPAPARPLPPEQPPPARLARRLRGPGGGAVLRRAGAHPGRRGRAALQLLPGAGDGDVVLHLRGAADRAPVARPRRRHARGGARPRRGGAAGVLRRGEAAALAAAVFAATSADVIRAMRGTDNAPTIFFWFCLAGLPVVLPFALDPWPALGARWLVAARWRSPPSPPRCS